MPHDPKDLPHFIAGGELEALLEAPDLVVIDLGRAEIYSQAHVPGARFLDYGRLVTQHGLTGGLMPPVKQLTTLFSDLGIGRNHRVIAYDEEGGGKAGRLCWTLDCLGHHQWSVLDGGIHAWLGANRPVSRDVPNPVRGNFVAWPNENHSANADYILERIEDRSCVLLDARSKEEYSGNARYSRRAGHIPGARHWEWTDAIDKNRNLQLRPSEELIGELTARNITPEHEVICYCQTHHRSSLSYVVLKHLGFENIRGYPGSWSEWGNRLDTPIE